jgi:hypothetical protein
VPEQRVSGPQLLRPNLRYIQRMRRWRVLRVRFDS